MFEHRDRQRAHDQVSQIWDAYVRGQDTDQASPTAETIHQLHQRAHTPEPSPDFAANLEATLMQTATDLAHWPSTTPSILGSGMLNWNLPAASRPQPGADPGRRTTRVLAAAAVLIAMIASLVAGSQVWRIQRSSLPPTHLPSLEAVLVATPQAGATPTADMETVGKLADQLWETPMGQDKVLTAPMGLALDSAGNVWVLDGADDHVQIFSPDGEHLETWGEHGTGEGQFDLGGRGDIVFASNGAFYVTDTANQRVQQFAPDRTFIRSWSHAGNRSGDLASPATATVLDTPNSIAIGPDGSVYVSDETRNVVERYTADGVWLNTLGSDSGDTRLVAPGGITFDQEGNVWVADYGRNRLVVFMPDGTFVRAVSGINLPTDLEFDRAGYLLLVDAKGLQVMNQDVETIGRIWRDQGMFMFLPNLAVGTDGRIYVVDYNLGFLTAFQLRDPLPAPPTPTPAA